MPSPTPQDLLADLGQTLPDASEVSPETAAGVIAALAAGASVGAPEAHPSDIMADLEALVVGLARRHPEAVLAAIGEQPAALASTAVLCAVAAIPGEASSAILLARLRDRRSLPRSIALCALTDRADQRLVPHLERLLRDRTGTVVYDAAQAARRLGSADLVPRLLQIATGPGPVGICEVARDAVEAICRRQGLPLPAEAGPARLLDVALPAGAAPLVMQSELVEAGRLLAAEVPSPCRAVVAAIDRSDVGITLTLRRR